MEKEINDKYYIPKIEEFHEGFEFEFRKNHSQEFNKTSISGNWCWNSFIDIEEIIDKENIRVKYLNEEDIKELGWKKVTLFNGNVYYIYEDINYVYKLYLIGKDHLQITSNDVTLIFNGTIKNKSELKRLLIQLNILTIDNNSNKEE